MQTRKLGTLEVSPIGMGCMGFSHGYGEIPDEAYSIEAIRKGYEFGCTFFDTAEAYAPDLQAHLAGHNERILGKAVKDFRPQVVLATKFHLKEADLSGNLTENIRRHLLRSLDNLQTDYADLYYLHRIHPNLPVEQVAEAMGRLIDEGLIRGWGLSQVGRDTIARAHAVRPLAAVQNIYSMVERGIERDVIPYCLAHQIGVVPFSPVASGLLSGKLKADSDFSHSDDVRKFVPQLRAENLAANQPLLDLLAEYAQAKSATPAQISLAWMLKKYPNVVPIPGSKNQARILENLGAWNVVLSDTEFTALQTALDAIPVHGHRGYEEAEGGSMANWGKQRDSDKQKEAEI